MEHSSRRDLDSSNIPLDAFPQGGFSLIAVIGVLAVITIGLSLVAPAFVKIFEREHQETERLQLERIAEGIQTYLEQNKAFPPSLASLIPDYVPFSAAQVSTNAHGFPRYYVAHPAMTGFNNRTGLSAAQLVDARFLLLSNLTQDVAPTITTPAEFETWWTTNESLTPNLHLHRSNVGHLFYSLAITPQGNGASFFINLPPAIDSGGFLLPTHNAFHLVGTTIGFDEDPTYSFLPEVQFALTTNTAYWFDPSCSTGKQWNPVLPNCLSPIVLYTFEEGSGTTVNDVSGVGTPLNLTVQNGAATSWVTGALSVDSPTIIESSGAATKIINAVTASNAITIEAWVKPANITQTGPSRIVTLSQDTSNRNLTMGQVSNAFDQRLRTTGTSLNGIPSITTPSGTATTTLTHVVYTRDATGSATIYVDSAIQASGTVGGNLSNWNTTYKLGLANEFTLNRTWLGELHRVAIYDTALSQSQVTQRYVAGAN